MDVLNNKTLLQLPEDVVTFAPVNSIKNRLDRFMHKGGLHVYKRLSSLYQILSEWVMLKDAISLFIWKFTVSYRVQEKY